MGLRGRSWGAWGIVADRSLIIGLSSATMPEPVNNELDLGEPRTISQRCGDGGGFGREVGWDRHLLM